MTSVEIDVDISEAFWHIRGIKEKMGNYKPVFQIAQEFLETANASNFANHGVSSGKPWAPYGTWSARAGQPVTMVSRRGGNLLESLTNLRGMPNEINDSTATFGTNIRYAQFHQYGTSNMPAREIVFEPVGFKKALSAVTDTYLTGLNPSLDDLKASF
jgi:phage gpG-like protein